MAGWDVGVGILRSGGLRCWCFGRRSRGDTLEVAVGVRIELCLDCNTRNEQRKARDPIIYRTLRTFSGSEISSCR